MPDLVVNVYRNDLIESKHYIDIAVVDIYGNNVYNNFAGEIITFWRSAAKPFQALPIIYSGAAEKYGFTDCEVAIITASHSGQDVHTETVKSILKKIDLDTSSLKCGIHSPLHRPTASSIRQQGLKPEAVHNNCSGKHSGLLTLCQYYGWSSGDYLNPEHPVQRMIKGIISEITEYPEDEIYLGEDGCGVPVFGLPLRNMALAYAHLSNPKTMDGKYQEAADKITSCMENNPLLVAGEDRFNTELMEVTGNKLVAKSGAEGVFCIGVHGKLGLAIKVRDGNNRAVPPAIIEILSKLEILDKEEKEALAKYHYPLVLNNLEHNVGKMVPVLGREE